MAISNALSQSKHMHALASSGVYENMIQPIVVVDDSPDDRHFLMNLIYSIVGKEEPVASFGSGKELIEYIEEIDSRNRHSSKYGIEIPKIIFLDLIMPKQDGLDVLQELYCHPLLLDVPIVLVTGSHNEKILNEAEKFGAKAVLHKPFCKNALLETVSKANELL